MNTELIYHYCSFETFQKILEFNTLRFSDVMKSNDRYEIIYLLQDYVDYVNKNSKNPSATNSLEWFICEQSKREMYLSLALSRNGDSLHLWNLYGKGGVSIGFNEAEFTDWLKKIRLVFKTNGEDKKCENQAACIKNVVYSTREGNERWIGQTFDEMGNDYIIDIFGPVYRQAIFRKSTYFDCEKEIRAFIHLLFNEYEEWFGTSISGIFYETDEHNSRKAEFSKNNAGEICFVDIPFPKDLIKTVIIDKDCPFEQHVIQRLLKTSGFSTKMITIKKSIGAHRGRLMK